MKRTKTMLDTTILLRRSSGILLLSLLLGAFLFVTGVCRAENSADTTVLFSDSKGKDLCTFVVDLAVTPEEQAQGLMFRKYMPSDSGMLFLNREDAMRSFWMRNTYIPLDMIFVDSRYEVKHIHYGAKPLDETSISSQYPVRYIVEINAGRAKKCHIRSGAKMSILQKEK